MYSTLTQYLCQALDTQLREEQVAIHYRGVLSSLRCVCPSTGVQV